MDLWIEGGIGFIETSDREYQASMETQGRGSSTPFYSYMVADRGRGGKKNKPPRPWEVKTKDIETQKVEGSKINANHGTHEEDFREEKAKGEGQGSKGKAKMGPCKREDHN